MYAISVTIAVCILASTLHTSREPTADLFFAPPQLRCRRSKISFWILPIAARPVLGVGLFTKYANILADTLDGLPVTLE